MQLVYDILKQIARRVDPARVEQFLAYSIIEKHFASKLREGRPAGRRESLWDELIAKVGDASPILFLEFGVFEGYSISYFSRGLGNPDSRFVGFDSFQGLPAEWQEKEKGHFSTQGRMPSISDARVSFPRGMVPRNATGLPFWT